VEVIEFTRWLAEHGHQDVAYDHGRVTSTLNGKARAYELVPEVLAEGSLYADVERSAYWKRVKS
jgi:hypothetical protein